MPVTRFARFRLFAFLLNVSINSGDVYKRQDEGRDPPPFTFTAHRRPYPGRGAPGKDGSLIRLQQQQYCCRLFFKVTAFIAGPLRYSLTMPHNPRRNLYAPSYPGITGPSLYEESRRLSNIFLAIIIPWLTHGIFLVCSATLKITFLNKWTVPRERDKKKAAGHRIAKN